MIVAGIDGGQTSTTAVLLDGDGTEIGRGVAGPSDHVDQPADSRRCADALESSVAAALAAGGLAPGTQLDAIVAGISGYDGVLFGIPPALPSVTVRFMHDAPIALAGAIGRRPGVVVIAGTGSVAYGEDRSGTSVRVGGWGYLFGDAGSGYALSRDALAYAMAENDRGVPSDLGAAACAFFDVPSLRALVAACTTNQIGRPQLASFARVVVDAARLGKTEAATLVDAAATALASLAALAIARLDLGDAAVPVAFTGGLASAGDMPLRLAEKLAVLAPHAHLVEPRNDPAVGAALLALAEAGSVARSS